MNRMSSDDTDQHRRLTLAVGWGAGIFTTVAVAAAWYGAYALALLSITHPLYITSTEVRCYLRAEPEGSQ